MNRVTRIAALLLLSTGLSAAWAGGHEQSEASADGSRTARVAGGSSITLVDSARSSKEWAEKRPDYRELIPKKR